MPGTGGVVVLMQLPRLQPQLPAKLPEPPSHEPLWRMVVLFASLSWQMLLIAGNALKADMMNLKTVRTVSPAEGSYGIFVALLTMRPSYQFQESFLDQGCRNSMMC